MPWWYPLQFFEQACLCCRRYNHTARYLLNPFHVLHFRLCLPSIQMLSVRYILLTRCFRMRRMYSLRFVPFRRLNLSALRCPSCRYSLQATVCQPLNRFCCRTHHTQYYNPYCFGLFFQAVLSLRNIHIQLKNIMYQQASPFVPKR